MSTSLTGVATLETRLEGGGTTVVPYLTGGFPTMAIFKEALQSLSTGSIAVEIGIPFSDPMADGATIQESSRAALEAGATLGSIVAAIEGLAPLSAELIIMSYLNPILAFGPDELMPRLGAAGVAALVVPDLPLEESGELGQAARESGIGLVQLVSPVTDPDRLATVASASEGFTYAVTMTGTTGGRADIGYQVTGYLDRVRAVSRPPVLAGFGVRTVEQVHVLGQHCDGVIVGSALVEVLAAGDDPVAFIEELRK
jgi:tryptophan synthase alpha chain